MLRIAFEFGADPLYSFLFLLLSIGVIYLLLVGILLPSDEKKEEENDEVAEANQQEESTVDADEEAESDDSEESAYTPWDEQPDHSGIIGVLTPQRGHLGTPILLDLNILLFILMALMGADFSS
ncbi:MAG: hypothetical protein PHH63_04345, partial [Bacteroidales bacterium]|nr:hypothetical protein [Bacteroidales bacterium]